MAYISRTPESDLNGEDILEFLGDRIARFKLPHYIEFAEEDKFPRSTSGKIQRQELED